MTHLYEFMATDATGRDLYDHEIERFVPVGARALPREGSIILFLPTRRAALATRANLLATHPAYRARIFEGPAANREEWAGFDADEEAFSPDTDGVLVLREAKP